MLAHPPAAKHERRTLEKLVLRRQLLHHAVVDSVGDLWGGWQALVSAQVAIARLTCPSTCETRPSRTVAATGMMARVCAAG